jgi:quercetin dioxygenase-like cupin family protein
VLNASNDSNLRVPRCAKFSTGHGSRGSFAHAVLLVAIVTLQLDSAAPHGNATFAPQVTDAAEAPRGCSTPVSERKTETGCYTAAETILGVLPAGSLFWHLDVYPSRTAAEAARGPKGTVTESFGKFWLFTIAEEQWRPPGGEQVAIIGPLVVATDKAYTARYMEALFPPGAQPAGSGPGHRHPGPEAWYVLSGAQCLETPNGQVMVSAGGAAMVPEGWPMAVSGVGSDIRRTVLLVLHPSSEPYTMAIDDPKSPEAPHSHWKPRGLCPK